MFAEFFGRISGIVALTCLIVFVVVYISVYLYLRLTCGECRANVCLNGKLAIITGGNSGIGFKTALGLAGRGCHVIIADVVDANASCQKAADITGNPKIEAMHVDMSDNDSIRKFAQQFKDKYNQLDILVNNAGIGMSFGKTNAEGIDLVLQVNYFGPFLLTHCLADVLKNTKGSRVVGVGSTLSFTQLTKVKTILKDETTANYSKSKLFLLIGTEYFAEKFAKYGVTANVVHPGLVKTKIHNINHQITLFKWAHLSSVYVFGKDPYQGAQMVIDAAISRRWNGVSNKFFSDGRPIFKPYQYYDEEFKKELIAISRKVTGIRESEEI